MWPFKSKTVPVPTHAVDPSISVMAQLTHAIKSVSLPETVPHWKLHPTKRADWDFRTAVEEGYNASAIVYACVEKRAKLIASVPWIAQKKVAGELVPQPDSDLQRLIDRPNPDVSWHEIIYNASQSLDLDGQAFISKIKAGVRGYPVELWYLPPGPMRIKPGAERLIDQYIYGQNRKIDADDMVMLKMPNPSDPIFGMPVLMAGGRATDIDREGGIWQKVSLENRGAADINIKLPENATQEQAAQAKASYNAQQAGPKNARKALITNADIQQLNQNAVEMDFVASRRAVWTEICAVFGLSLSNLGMTEDVNLANADAMESALWKNTIVPQFELIERQLTHFLAKDFGPEWVLTPDFTNVEALQENRTAVIADASSLFNMGIPFDQINARLELGFDSFEGSDIGYVPSGLIPTSYNTGGEDGDNEADANADAAFGSNDDDDDDNEAAE